MRGAAYIRRSVASDSNTGEVSREAQLTAVRGLAMAAGLDPAKLAIYDDWGKSADELKKAKRTRYLALLDAIGKRRYSHVFAYHTDRLIRSVADFTELLSIAGDHTVVQVPGMTLTGPDPMARAFAQLSAVFAELEMGRIRERARKGTAVRVARDDDFGSFRYGYRTTKQAGTRKEGEPIRWVRDPDVPLDRVLGVVRANGGNILRSCKALEAQGIAAPRGGIVWSTSALTRIVEREAPETRSRRDPAGKRRPTRSVLSNLVACPKCPRTADGTPVYLTPVGTRDALYCRFGSRTEGHGKYYAKQHAILDLLHAETDGRTVTKARLDFSQPTDDALETARVAWQRANRRYQAGGISDDEYDRIAARWKAAQQEAAVDEDDDWISIQPGQPLVRWDADVKTVNEDLRRHFSEVTLDPATLAPIGVVGRRARVAGSKLSTRQDG